MQTSVRGEADGPGEGAHRVALVAGLADSDEPPERTLRAVLLLLISIGRTRPHLYRLMFTTPTGDPTAAVRAADRTWDLFLDIVARVVGPEQARRYRALLLTNAHGIASFESSGHPIWEKWQIGATSS